MTPLERVQRELERYEHPLVEFSACAGEHGEVELAIRFKNPPQGAMSTMRRFTSAISTTRNSPGVSKSISMTVCTTTLSSCSSAIRRSWRAGLD